MKYPPVICETEPGVTAGKRGREKFPIFGIETLDLGTAAAVAAAATGEAKNVGSLAPSKQAAVQVFVRLLGEDEEVLAWWWWAQVACEL